MNIFTRKRILFFLITILSLLLFSGCSQEQNKKSPAPQPISPVSGTTVQKENEQNPPSEEKKRNDNRNDNSVKVSRVIDGDTIEVEGGEKIRYIGIDTPETVDPRKPVQCFGVESFNKNKELVEGKEIRLEKDVSERDKYNRLLRYVYVGDIFVNLELIKQGFAYSYSYPPDIKYQDQFVKAQQEARKVKRGLWSICQESTQTQTSTTPQTQTQTQNQTNNSSGSCTIKGNISSTNEKIYHLIGCGSYNQTKIDEGRGERWFCSEQEAVTAGWRKAKNCP